MAAIIVISLSASCVFAAETTTSPVTSAPMKQTPPSPTDTIFDGKRAYEHLVKQVEFGPRLPDSPGIEKTRAYILAHLETHGFSTGTQNFMGRSELLGRVVEGKNLYGVFPPGAQVKYLFSAHYDTRPAADMAPPGSGRNTPVPGANDGASGVAVLLELARVLQAHPPAEGVALVFFDLEDHGLPARPKGFCLGSRHMASQLPPELKGFKGGINLDMVGDRDLRLPVEGFSMRRAPELVKAFWDVGAGLYPQVFVKQVTPPVFDDHAPFQEAGFPYIDVIDFEYPFWHTPEDTPDKCSADSLEAVGRTVAEFLRR